MSTMGQVQAHEPLMRPHDRLVRLQVGRATAQALDVDTPLLRVQAKRLKRALLAEKLYGVNLLVAAIVAGTGVALGVLVRHGRAKSVKDSARCDIFRGNEEDGFALTLDLFFLRQLESYI